ncbi:glycosyltransferase family 4 protein [Stenotrophomonas mori]|uniref:Glycosyltransferase family 4 protein n=1 Tax=Stenotrophomonas mori TaxID=2871096 RepID=A0ABT0SKD4_9GAMM|nr:glycosyltransferase family 4 protein [Stenotrophomonas mori]MCL7715430.1 glycosyltransferase family 4 protein [Stenotrophomonas mori]
MKVLFTNFHSGSGGGHTTYTRELARALGTRHEVHVAAPAGSTLLIEAGALPHVQALAQPFPNGLHRLGQRRQAIRQLRAYLRAHRFDIVHVNGSADHRITLSALRGVTPRPRVVLTKHNTKPMRGLQHVLRARRHTDKVIAVCEYVRRQLQATPYRVCHPQTVYNGVDTAHFRPWPPEAAAAERRRLGIADDVLVIGSNAGTADYKGWTDLIAAVGLLAPAEQQRLHIVVAGAPPTPAQRAAVAAAGLAAPVHFPGLLRDVRPLIATLDAGFVLSHDVETISFACREMMAMGKPVMVSDYAGLPENIRAGEDGWVVPVHGHQAMAAALRTMLRDPGRLPRMGEAARAHALAEFGLERFVDATEAIYRGLLVTR